MNLASTQYSLIYKSFELYISGCREHPCIGCHTTELWDENIGLELHEGTYNLLRKKILNNLDIIDNFFIMGGEPLEKPKEEVLKLIQFLKEFKKPVWLFTRFELEEVDKDIIKELNYIKTGKYKKGTPIIVEQGIELASSNQKITKLK